jgi:hypothetical protein
MHCDIAPHPVVSVFHSSFKRQEVAACNSAVVCIVQIDLMVRGELAFSVPGGIANK